MARKTNGLGSRDIVLLNMSLYQYYSFVKNRVILVRPRKPAAWRAVI